MLKAVTEETGFAADVRKAQRGSSADGPSLDGAGPKGEPERKELRGRLSGVDREVEHNEIQDVFFGGTKIRTECAMEKG